MVPIVYHVPVYCQVCLKTLLARSLDLKCYKVEKYALMMVRSSSPSVHLLVVLDVDVGDDRTGVFEVRHNIPICFHSGTDSSSRPLLNWGRRKNSHTP
jgi:hypothetical protein